MTCRHHRSFRITTLVVVSLFLGTGKATAQDRLSKVEWFIEGGGSFLRLGDEPNEVPIFGSSTPGYLVSSKQFSSGGLFLTGLRYHLTTANALEVSYNMGVWNYFQIQPITPGAQTVSSRFERQEYSLNYVRYLSKRGLTLPFLTAGLGATETATLATAWHAWNPSINFGFGTDFPINGQLAFRLQVRDHVGFLPGPLRGASHDITPTAGLVLNPRPSSGPPGRYPQVEIFLEGGLSLLTGGTGTYSNAFADLGNGQIVPYYGVRGTNYFSKSGRVFAGFRVYFTPNNAVELSTTENANGYAMTMAAKTLPPDTSLLLEQQTLSLEDYSASFVRYFLWRAGVKPFATVGAGDTHFAGRLQDVDKFNVNLGVGADVPLLNHLVARFEFRDYLSQQPNLTSGALHNFSPTVGLAYRFN
jgi:hypothetical protein